MTKMLCPICGRNEASNCKHGIQIGGKLDPPDFDCDFWWEDTLQMEAPDCENCPLVWCEECKNMALANYYAILNAGEIFKHTPVLPQTEEVELNEDNNSGV